jgi:flagellin
MRIQNNIMAINTHRQLGINQLNQSKSTEKLSSGFRINRAADDAAGLSISEKMRSQIRGLNRASMNALDGISMIQAAEGALQESHKILQRMRELAVQGANDVNAVEDRNAIKSELHQLGMELDRIADTTNFNGKYVLSGLYAKSEDGEPIFEVEMNPMINDLQDEGFVGTLYIQAGANTLAGDTIGLNMSNVNANALLNIEGEGFWAMMEGYGETGALNSAITNGEDIDFDVPAKFADVDERAPSEDGVWSISGFQALVNVIDGLNFDGTAVEDPLETPKTGIALISELRSELGAVQNRLEHTIANIDTVAENMQAAESRIRDVDMAKEMMAFTRNNILNQAATAMLAQANQLPQTVLQLLQ